MIAGSLGCGDSGAVSTVIMLPEGGGRGHPAPAQGPAGRVDELGGHHLVGPGRGVRAVPSPAVGVDWSAPNGSPIAHAWEGCPEAGDRSLTCKNSVELRGFEPLTPSMRTRCATGLRYSPENLS